jgi:multiple sugar transport system substrate-binding protein
MTRLWVALLLVASLVLAACGGGGETGQTATTDTGTQANPTAADVGAVSTPAATGAESPTAGTGVGAAGSPMPAGSPAAAAACPQNAQGQQITYWNGFSGQDGPFMTALVDKFNAENQSGIKATQTILPFDQYYTKVDTAQGSDTLPDVMQVHLDQVPTRAARNTIRPIPNELLNVVGVTQANYPEAVWNATQVNGERYSIPLDINGIVMYHNQDLAKQAGVTPGAKPLDRATYEKLVTGANGKNGAMGWSITTGFPISQMFQTLLYQFGGTLFNEDGTEPQWNSPQGVQALQYLKDWQGKASRPNLPVDAGVAAFKQGKSAVEWNGTWQISNLTGKGFQQGAMAPIPNVGGKYAVAMGSHTLALPKHRKGEDEAKTAAAVCFMSFLSSNSLEWVQGGGHIPARNDVRDSAEFKALPNGQLSVQADAAVFPPPVAGLPDTLGPQGLEQAVIDFMSGKETDAKAALDKSAERAKKIIEQNKQNYGG